MPYVGEIRIFAGTFAPVGWEFCQGQQLPISQYEVLFNLIGTTYGGDGQETFNLPNLAGRVPVHQGTNPGDGTYVVGEPGGVETVTVSVQQTPSHTHALLASSATGNRSTAAGGVLAMPSDSRLYYRDVAAVAMDASLVDPVGGSQPHENMQPFVVVNFIIATSGTFPHQ